MTQGFSLLKQNEHKNVSTQNQFHIEPRTNKNEACAVITSCQKWLKIPKCNIDVC